jgi:hypothetical protein
MVGTGGCLGARNNGGQTGPRGPYAETPFRGDADVKTPFPSDANADEMK